MAKPASESITPVKVKTFLCRRDSVYAVTRDERNPVAGANISLALLNSPSGADHKLSRYYENADLRGSGLLQKAR